MYEDQFIDSYWESQTDPDCFIDPIVDYPEYEDDGQPTEYEEWQDLYGGDDWDQGQYDNEY